MRIDEKGKQLPLTLDQRFFVSCWFNMVHQHSLDSHRVRTMNPHNILRELLRLYDLPHASEEDRWMVCDETLLVLSTDPVLKQPAAAKVGKRIRAHSLHILRRTLVGCLPSSRRGPETFALRVRKRMQRLVTSLILRASSMSAVAVGSMPGTVA